MWWWYIPHTPSNAQEDKELEDSSRLASLLLFGEQAVGATCQDPLDRPERARQDQERRDLLTPSPSSMSPAYQEIDPWNGRLGSTQCGVSRPRRQQHAPRRPGLPAPSPRGGRPGLRAPGRPGRPPAVAAPGHVVPLARMRRR